MSSAPQTYEPFMPFAAWQPLLFGDQWSRYHQRLQQSRSRSEQAAVESVNNGLRLASVDAAGFSYIDPADETPRSPLGPYDLVLQAAAGRRVDETVIRHLHAELCRSQRTYESRDPEGVTLRDLEGGVFKHEVTHLARSDGSWMECAPVEATAEEVARLSDELAGPAFMAAHPVLQASYAHYGLLAIHPFPDGNGRVARALASVYFERELSLPLLVLAGHRDEYLLAAEAAHDRQGQQIVEFVYRRGIDVMALASDSLQSLTLRTPETAVTALAGERNGGPVPRDRLVGMMQTLALQAVSSVLCSLDLPATLEWFVDTSRGGNGARSSSSFSLTIVHHTGVPSSVTRRVEVAVASDDEAVVGVRSPDGGPVLDAQAEELRPTVSAVLGIRLHMWARHFVGEVLHRLVEHAEHAQE